MNNKTEYFVGIFGFMQLSMQDVGLLNTRGVPIKLKNPSINEVDTVNIYNWVSDKLVSVPKHKLDSMGREVDKKVKKLISDHSKVNNFLLSILLLREYLDNEAPRNEQLMILPKVHRVIELLDSAITDEEFSVDVRRTTARTANNLYRMYVGKPQMGDDVRDLVANKYRNKER